MKTTKTLTASVAALLSLGTLAAGIALTQPVQAQTPPSPMMRPHRGGERHPELRRALASLVRTEALLRRSARDFGGHREKAADLCHQAQGEIQQALQYDKN